MFMYTYCVRFHYALGNLIFFTVSTKKQSKEAAIPNTEIYFIEGRIIYSKLTQQHMYSAIA